MLVEMAHKLRGQPVLGGESSSQPPVLVTSVQRRDIERHIFLASSGATSLSIFVVTQDWHDLVKNTFSLLRYLIKRFPRDSVDKRVIQLSSCIASVKESGRATEGWSKTHSLGLAFLPTESTRGGSNDDHVQTRRRRTGFIQRRRLLSQCLGIHPTGNQFGK